MTAPLVVLDGDDTLWRNQFLYIEARRECMQLAKACGLNPKAWRKLQLEVDAELVPVFHFSIEHFPTACAEAYRRLARRAGYSSDEAVAQQFYDTARTVFDRPCPVYPGTASSLRRLRAAGCHVVLLTKGDGGIQAQRISDSGLGEFFDEVVIVGKKTPEMFQSLCRWAGVKPDNAYSIGNSLRSDIEPALSVGMRGIHLPHETWAYEKNAGPLPQAGLTTVRRLSQAVTQIERELAAQISPRDRGLAA